MAFNEKLVQRVRELLAETDHDIEEKKIFSGVAFMVNGKMCVSVGPDRVMVRIAPAAAEAAWSRAGCRPMVRSGTSMKGYVYVDISLLTTKKELSHWVNEALAFNPYAKSSRK